MSQFSDWIQNITFNPKQAESFADVMLESAYLDPAISAFHTVVPGIKAKKKIPYAGRLTKITKADAGCGTGKTSQAIPTSEKEWDPVKTKSWLSECADDLETMFEVWNLNPGEERTDFSTKSAMMFLSQKFSEAQAEDALRQAWLSDTAYVAGDLTGGAGDLPNYNIFDGLWKQLVAVGTADANRRSTISENAQSTYAAQLNLGSTFAIDLFREMFEKADPRLRARPDAFYLVTDEIFFNYMTYLESQGVDSSYTRIENGVTSLRYRSRWVYNMNIWTRYIASDFAITNEVPDPDETAYDTPNRAVLTTRENLLLGYDSPSAVGASKIWYNIDEEEVNIRNKYKVDAKIGWDHMVQLGY